MSFEGAEKLLEIWFHAGYGTDTRLPSPSPAATDENHNPLIPSMPRASTAVSHEEMAVAGAAVPVADNVDAAVASAVPAGLKRRLTEGQLATPALSDEEDDEQSSVDGAAKKRKLASGAALPVAQILSEAAAAVASGSSNDKATHDLGLRAVGRDTWQEMLNLVKCQILNVISNEHSDAYLLSESSLFVFRNRVILKTCGTTTLLLALPRIMEIASQLCGLKAVDKLFYSRMCFQFPEKQHWPHSSWDHEVEILDGLFANGSAYVLGKSNSDHWYLYVTGEQLIPSVASICSKTRSLVVETEAAPILSVPSADHANLAALTSEGTDPPDLLACIGARAPPGGVDGSDANGLGAVAAGAGASPLAPASPTTATTFNTTIPGSSGHHQGGAVADDVASETGSMAPSVLSTTGSCSSCADVVEEDRTLEMLMTGLDQEMMHKYFIKNEHNTDLGDGTKNAVEAATGLDQLLPGCVSDSFLFHPCGWSQNALLGEHYGTFHVTPEEACSYASFETNVPLSVDSADPNDPFTYKAVTKRVLDVFKPTNVTLTHFSNDVGVHPSPVPPSLPVIAIEGYRLLDISVNVLPHYHLFYCHYVRECPETGRALKPKKTRRVQRRAKVLPASALASVSDAL
ncbi:S-adenosylmethionine decarboxylase [Blastocladiella britannica]|nr:S-adenosylmethionine decarboxylase [Blastocladiella britannica]